MLGPTRMDYPGTIATVRAVARYVGEVLAQQLIDSTTYDVD